MPKKLRFDDSLVEPILAGSKKATWRLNDDKDLTEGDILELIRYSDKTSFATAMITQVVEKPFAELTEEDWQGHERFSTDEEMYTSYAKYYNQPVDPKTKLKIVRFELLNLNNAA